MVLSALAGQFQVRLVPALEAGLQNLASDLPRHGFLRRLRRQRACQMPFSDGAPRPDEPDVGFALAIATPRAAARITAFSTAGFLAFGSSLPAAFPVSLAVLPVACGPELAGYSCGGSRGLHRVPF